ncbi:hypothetical protein H3N34_01710 [Photobacterium damselae subsp. damselae]|uniref:hypothetical protein n=1 Tax=Photobacterium damselae TaxID=38293 RepID=UPI0015F45133|nr:hypothetical protein [Photobacterium damselae]MBA5681929.1 hypothetical protein [Photobacterium damselae subsp. damselae]
MARSISIPFADIEEMLDPYIYFQGLVFIDDKIRYVDGYFIIHKTEVDVPDFTREEIESGYALCEPDMPVYNFLVEVKGTKYSNNDELIGTVYRLKTKTEIIDEVLFSYEQLCKVASDIGYPKPIEKLQILAKDYAYDLKVINQKSNFTLSDAAKIAANIEPTTSIEVQSQKYSYNHYLELLSDCIKGTNQHKFKLHTVELWTSHHDEFGERYSQNYKNGTLLKQRAELDCDLTIISKQEFLRWSEYQGLDIGLEYQPQSINKSIEVLEMMLSESEEEISRLRNLLINKNSLIPESIPPHKNQYPPELQIAIDAYEELCLNEATPPTNKVIQDWLKIESKQRGITHKDGSDQVQGLSQVKLERIASMIKSR